MKVFSSTPASNAQSYIQRKARPLEQAVYHWIFESDAVERAWDALAWFQNEDGGFGNAIEPDVRAPASSGIGAITAGLILKETQCPADHPLVKGVMTWLIENYKTEWQGWRIQPQTVNEHPHAPWWHVGDDYDPTVNSEWANPTAACLSMMYRWSSLVPEALLVEVSTKAMDLFRKAPAKMDAHDFLVYIELAEEAPAEMADELWEGLKSRAMDSLATDPDQWGGYGVRPLWAVTHPGSPLMEVLGDLVQMQLDWELDQQQEDGSWHPFWAWGQYEDVWEKAKIEWQGVLTLKNLKAFKAFGRMA